MHGQLRDDAEPAQAGADERLVDYDSPWKEAIAAYFQPFMALFFPAIHDWIDWNRPYEFLDAELRQITGDAEIGRRAADRLIKVYRVEGVEVWLLIHIEVQGRADARFQVRMFQYYYRIYDRYGDVEILSLAVVTNQTPDPDLGTYQRERDGYGVRFRFRVQALRVWNESTLIDLAARNPFAVVALAQRAAHRRWKDEKRKVRKREIVTLLYRYRYGREDVLKLLRFIDWLIRLPDELEQELRAELMVLAEEKSMAYVTSFERFAREEGREEGREEARKEVLDSQRQLLLRLVRKRFNAGVMEHSRPLLGAIAEMKVLEDLAEALLDCADGEAWLAMLERRIKSD